MKKFLYFILSLLIILIIFYHLHNLRLRNKIITKQELEEEFQIRAPEKIAFCFLTVNDVNHYKIWDKFFKFKDDKFSIYMHPKNLSKVKSFFKKYVIPHYVKTAWGDISLADATYLMLREAYKDKKNKKMILLSDSCIPLKKFDLIYKKLLENDKSWFNYYSPTKKSVGHFDRLMKLSKYFKKSYIQEQWMILDRKHVKAIIENYEKLRPKFNILNLIPDECIFITMLFNLIPNVDNELQFEKHTREQFKSHNYVTFADWYNNGKLVNSYHPKTFNKITPDSLDKLKNANTFFARKFAITSDVENYWDSIVE